MRKLLKNLLLSLPFLNKYARNYFELVSSVGFYKPGHFYNPIPDIVEVERNANRIFSEKVLADVELNTAEQLQLLEKFGLLYPEYPYFTSNNGGHAYRYRNTSTYYNDSDSIFLYSILRHFQPAKLIEVGSGDSSALMLDINDRFLGKNAKMTFIEPFPEERLLKILSDEDQKMHEVMKHFVQDVSLEKFKELGKNDILFIDSSHVSKVGSDLNYLIFEVLPILQSGVLIHFHDIYFPFEMPKHWITEYGYFWNENYLLHAFLMNNNDYKIIAFNTYLHKINREFFDNHMPYCLKNERNCGSIWLQKN